MNKLVSVLLVLSSTYAFSQTYPEDPKYYGNSQSDSHSIVELRDPNTNSPVYRVVDNENHSNVYESGRISEAARYRDNVGREAVEVGISTSYSSRLSLEQQQLHNAVIGKDNEQIRSLIDAGADVDYVSSTGVHLIFTAVKSNNYKLIKEIIDSGIDTKIKDSNGFTPVIHAVLNNSLESLKVLIAESADLNSTVKYFKDLDVRLNLLELAVMTSSNEIIKQHIKANIEVKNAYKIALVENRSKEIIKLLANYQKTTTGYLSDTGYMNPPCLCKQKVTLK